MNRRVGGLREQLRTQADPEHGRLQVEESLQKEVLLAKPGVVFVLVGVHRTAEHEHGVVGVKRTRQRRFPRLAPLLEAVPTLGNDVAEDSGPHLFAVDDGQDIHYAEELTGTFSAWSKRCSAFAFAAACAIRPPRPSGLVALLLKKA